MPASPNESFLPELDTAERLRILQYALAGVSQAVVITDADNLIQYANPAYEALTGYSAAELVGRTPRLLQSGHHDASFYETLWGVVERDGRWSGEIWDRGADGASWLVHLSIQRFNDASGHPHHYLGIFQDVSNQSQTEAQLERLTHYDALTELPNRLLFRNRLAHEFNVANRHNSSTGLILLNLDRFRAINDTFGFAAGDRLLQEVAQRFEGCIRRTDLMAKQENRLERNADMVSRMSGDDFAFVLGELRKPDDAGVVADRLMAALEEPFLLEGEEVYVSASMGIAIYPENAETADGLQQCVETTLARQKGAGRGGYLFFSEEMNESSAQRVRMEARMRRAMADGDFHLHYQPKLDLAANRVEGIEALLRWPTEDGFIPPAEFIPLAEDIGLIRPLGEWILDRAVADTLAIEARTGQRLQCAVNLSVRQFQHPRLVDTIRDTLQRHGLSPERLELEITEGMLMHDVDEVRRILEELRGLGVHLAIDDFGTGYSSLAYLSHFPVNTLKIDKSFIDDIDAGISGACIVAAAIDLGVGLGLRVVAEGVETLEQLNLLRTKGSHQVQGYHVARPQPIDDFIDWLNAASGG
ncbi:MAG: putative bifunctional diguanylate cyclase/phosphodiesterase [Pseudomonadota bacterium]